MKMKYYSFTVEIDGDYYDYQTQAADQQTAIDAMFEEGAKMYSSYHGVDIDADDMPAVNILAMTVTAEKPEKWGAM